jgi:hypothetical protein
MPRLVDPATGDIYDVADDDAEERQRTFGLVSPEQYQARQESPLTAAARVGSAAVAAPLEMADKGLRKLGLGSYDAASDPNASPDAREWQKKNEAGIGEFFTKAAAAKEAHPIAALAGEAVPLGIMGALSGGIGAGLAGGTPLVGAGAGLLADSALQGASQEAVDAITQKRDFSGKAALMNGGVNLVFGGLLLGAGHVLSGGLGRAAGEAAESVGARAASEVPSSGVRPAEGVPGPRNILSEIDPGEVPEAIGGARRQARSAERQARSVGARGNTPETMPAHEVEHFIRNEETIVDDMRTVAGGGPGEKGAFQEFNESFREVTANRVKRQDFDAAESLLDDATRRELALTTDTVADELATVASTLESRGAKRQAGILRAHITELGTSANKTGVLDRAKQTLDDLHMRAIVDKTDPYGEVLDAVNPAAERIRATLENPRFVGDKIAELQQVRNSAWSDKDTGFIRNMQIANETGVKLFKKIDRDYHTGDLVMQFDPGAFKQLLSLDAHESKPVLEAWAKVLDSAERMAANTVEVGAQSAGRAPVGKLNDSIGAIREIFTTQDKRIAARDLARPGQELLSRAEQIPGVGPAIRGAKAVLGKERVESFVAGAASRHVPVPERSVAKARAALQRHAPAMVTPEAPGGPPSVPPPRGPGAGSSGGTGGNPQAPPGLPANDVRGQVAGVAALAGGGALLASGTAGAAERLPEQQQSRDALSAHLATLPPDQQQATLHTAEAFARIAQKTTQRVQGAVKDLFALAHDPKAKPRYRSPQARELDRRSVELDVPRHLAKFMGKTDDPVEAWRDKSELINAVVADPAKLARTMADNLGDLATQQPEMFAGMVGQTMATIDYLHERMPGVAGRSALDPHGYPPTFEEISEWAGHWVGAIHPLDSLDDLASNELVPEQIEAVQSLWPEGYAMFQSAAMGQIHELSQRRGVIPLEALEQIDNALDLDGAGEPVLSSAFKRLLKTATAKDAEKMKAEAPKQLPPMQSQSPSRLASSSLASFHAE